jgi:RecB family exonuclease
VITPRRTRLVRVPDLHGFRRVIRVLAGSPESDEAGSRLIIVPNRAAARQIAGSDAGPKPPPPRLRRPAEASEGGRSGVRLHPNVVITRDELYEQLQARVPGVVRRLTPFERDAIAQAAAAEASRTVPNLSFQVRPELVSEILRFYDHLRRQSQTVKRFAELIEQALGGEAASDRGAERMLRQTRFLARTFIEYERRLAASGACDEHVLRARLMAEAVAPPCRHVLVTVPDWIADPDGLFVADFDLLSRMPGLEAIDVVCTEAVLESGFHQRLHGWLPGLEESAGEELVGDRSHVRPVLVVPAGAAPEQPWFTYRDREEELVAVARAYGRSNRLRQGYGGPPKLNAKAEDLRHNSGWGDLPVRRTAVVYKRPLPYLYLAPATLGAAGLPYQTSDALPLAAEPTAAAVDLALEAVETSFARDAIVALLRSPHFQFGKSKGMPREAVSALDRLLSEKRYLGDLSRLEAVAAEGEAVPAIEAALAIARELAPLGNPAPASVQLGRLQAFLSAHARPLEDADPFARRERRAREAIAGILEGLAAAHAGHHDPPWTISDLARGARRWIQEKTFVSDDSGSGIQLLDDQAARYGDFDDIAIVGLIETDWPERPRRNIFYPPSLLKALGWPSERDRRAAASARFLDLLRSATRRITLSTFTLEDEALVTRSTELDEIPRARLSTVPEEKRDDPPLFPDDALVLTPPVFDDLGDLPREWARLRLERPASDLPAFHGTIGMQASREWSVSALETYLECPFKFFARHVLALDEEPEDEEVMDPRRQGQFVHTVFEEFFKEWQTAGHGAITPDNLDDARAIFVEVVDRELADAAMMHAEAGLERTRLLGSPAASGLGEAVFRMEAERPLNVIERRLEFRLSGEITLNTSAGPRVVALRGKADRIDLLEDGTFRLIDYKLGWPPDRARALQLPIYGLAAEQRLQNHRGRRWTLGEAAYLAFKGPRRVVPLFSSPVQRVEVMDKAQERVSETLDAIARGEFPPRPDDVYRCETCGFASVCRKDYV